MKKILFLILLLIFSSLGAKAQLKYSFAETENWVNQELLNCPLKNQFKVIDTSLDNSLSNSAPTVLHPNGWQYPTNSSNYCGYLNWLGFNSAFNGYHLAQDMCNPQGNPVYAIDSGDVIYSSTSVGGYGGPSGATPGGAIVIQHRASDGTWFTALYGHLDSPHAVGHIYAGDVIGFSNNWNPPHVHFGVRLGYDPDPANRWTGYTSTTSNPLGFTNPITFLSSYNACKDGSSVNFRPNNNAPIHPNGTLIKSPSDSTVYLIRNGQKQGIASATILRSLYPNGGFDFKDIITVAQDEFGNYPTGAVINSQLPSNGRTHSEGRLIRRSTGGEISIVTDNGMRRAFVSANVFLNLGYLFCNVVDATDTNYDSYPVGAPVTGLPTVATVLVTIQTNPVNRAFSVDGTSYTSTQTFNWTSGASHTIATTSPQSGAAGTQYIWANWSNGSAISQTVSPTTATTYTANFTTQYQLTMSAGTGGTVSPTSGNWYNAGQTVPISATPSSGSTFSSWSGSGSGSYSGANSSATVTMNSPISQTANFTTTQCNYSINPTNQSLGSNGGTGTVNITTASGCAWTSTSNASWITITSGSTGAGNGTVGYSVAQNNTTTQRQGTITIGGQIFTVTQAEPTNCPSPSAIAIGQTISGSLQNGDCLYTDGSLYDAYTFNGTAGQQIYITLNSTQFNAYLFLFQGSYPGGTLLAQDNDGGGGTNARIPATSGFLTLPANGTYTILANSLAAGERGAYTINLTASSGTCAASSISPGQTISGSLTTSDCIFVETNRYVDVYNFNGIAGQSIAVSMNSSAFDTYLYLVNSSNQILVENDDGGGGTNSRIPANSGFFTIPATGTYSIWASSFSSNSTGAYNLTLTVSSSNACDQNTPIILGQTTNGVLTTSDCLVGSYYTDKYSFSGTAGQQIVIAMNSTAVDAYLILNNSSGQSLVQDDNGGGGTNARIPAGNGNYLLPTTGNYIIEASTFPAFQTGAYTISLTPGTSPPTTRKAFDFDGDGKSDISVFRPSTGAWYLLQSSEGFKGVTFGLGTDKLVPADYDGDGKTDVAVYRNGTWYLLRSQLGFTGVAFGDSNDIPVPADYDGDDKADIAVFRPSNGAWYLQRSQLGFTGISFGQNGDKPVPADYDGDGKADIALNRNGIWYISRSQLGFTGIAFGDGNDKLVPADYDGDGKADIAVFRPSNGTWYLLQSTDGFRGIQFGLGTDLPVPADYDGDGKSDLAVFRNGTWYLNRSTAGFTGVAFGAADDKPIPNAFVR